MANWTLDGGNNDTFGTDLSDLIFGEGGNDTLRGSSTGTSTTDNDSLYGGAGNDSLDGGTGNDLINGGSGADTLVGGDGADTLSYVGDTAGVTVTINTNPTLGIGGDAQGDSIAASSFEALEGGSGNDSLTATVLNATMVGNAGADTLVQNTSGSNSLDGGTGNDSLASGAGNDSLIGGAGDDVLFDRATSGTARNLLIGGDGNDTLSAAPTTTVAGQNTLDGGAGNDSLTGGINSQNNNNDSLSGGDGDDTLVDLNGFNNRLDGGADNDSLLGGAGTETLIGGLGNDTLDGGANADSLVGDGGDFISIVNDTGGLTVNLTALTISDGDALQGLFGGVIGGSGNDSILGNTGANTLIGNGGADRIDGDQGNDLIQGGAGNDTLIGGSGADTISYADTTAGVTVNLAGGRGGGTAAGFNDSIAADFEAALGGSGNDSLVGTAASESLYGGGGGDTLADIGGGGNWLDGAAGNDSLIAGPGNDTLLGGADSNLIVAAGGADSILGGGGADSVVAGEGDDRIGVNGLALGRMTLDGGAGSDTLDLRAGAWVVGAEGGFTTYSFDDGSGGAPDSVVWTTGIEQVICFYPGTLIATPDGPRAVETLAIGDRVLTHEGAAAPVRWMGRQTVSTRFGDPMRVLPIRIMAGALGEGLPLRDLLVSPDHAVLVGGVLVQAGALVNDATILRQRAVPERFTYHHVELATHALILAEGVPAETFVDNVDRGAFDNWAEHEALYGHLPSIAEMRRPRAKARRQVPARILAMLDARAGLRAAG